jgi:hypothetical protein
MKSFLSVLACRLSMYRHFHLGPVDSVMLPRCPTKLDRLLPPSAEPYLAAGFLRSPSYSKLPRPSRSSNRYSPRDLAGSLQFFGSLGSNLLGLPFDDFRISDNDLLPVDDLVMFKCGVHPERAKILSMTRASELVASGASAFRCSSSLAMKTFHRRYTSHITN